MQDIIDEIGMSEEEFERQYLEATRRGEEEMMNAQKAASCRYDRKTKHLIIDLQSGITTIIPTRLVQIFQNATDDEISDVEILLNGLYLRWDRLDEDLSVPLLLQGRFGTPKWMAELNSNLKTEKNPHKKVA